MSDAAFLMLAEEQRQKALTKLVDIEQLLGVGKPYGLYQAEIAAEADHNVLQIVNLLPPC